VRLSGSALPQRDVVVHGNLRRNRPFIAAVSLLHWLCGGYSQSAASLLRPCSMLTAAAVYLGSQVGMLRVSVDAELAGLDVTKRNRSTSGYGECGGQWWR
jgi:hypothetical protein